MKRYAIKRVAGRYRVIYADPAWLHRDKNSAGREVKYNRLATEEIAALDVPSLAARDSALFMWAVPPMLPEALYVMREWGFRFSTVAFCWVKTAPATWRARAARALRNPWLFGGAAGLVDRATARGVVDVLDNAGALYRGLRWGQGQTTRANVELVLLGLRGRLGRASAGVHQVVEAPPGRHSEKPHEVRRRIVQLMGEEGARVELFARERFFGWDAHGDDPAMGTPDIVLPFRPALVESADAPVGDPLVLPGQLPLLEVTSG